jgi:hypothetical protein
MKITRSHLLCENIFYFHFPKCVYFNLLIRGCETLEVNNCDGEKMKCIVRDDSFLKTMKRTKPPFGICSVSRKMRTNFHFKSLLSPCYQVKLTQNLENIFTK